MASNKFAVIRTGGKQYNVREGSKLKVEKLSGQAGEIIKFDEVLLRAGEGKVEIGNPLVGGAAVEAEVTKQGRDEKKIIFRYHSKTRYRKFKGHRQPFTELKIKSIK